MHFGLLADLIGNLRVMGLFRTAIVVGAVVALMPTDRNQQAQVYDKAAAAAKWTITFCERNGELCKQGGELWGTFVQKAQFAGQMAVQLIQEQAASRSREPGDGSRARRQDAVSRDEVPLFERRDERTEREADVPVLERREARQAAGTLRQDDMRPEWRGRDQQLRQPRRGY